MTTRVSDLLALRRPHRVDAARNFDAVLAAARALFAEQGPDVLLADVARRAEVGAATLYRHFPTRDDLLEAVFRGRIDALSQLGDDLLASPEPFDALTIWLRAHLVNASACQGLAGSVLIDLLDEEDDGEPRGCEHMRGIGAQLLERAQENGSARPDADADDLVRLVNALVSATDDADDRSALADRLFTLMIDGLRAQPRV